MRQKNISENVDIPHKRIDITRAGNASPSSNLQQVSNTKSPIMAQRIAAWEFDDARAVENAQYMLLEDGRIEGE